MYLSYAGVVSFALIVHIYCLNQKGDVNTDCLHNESDASSTETNKDIPVLSLILRVLGISSQTNEQNCINHRLHMIEYGLHDLKVRLNALAADSLLKISLTEAREAFDDVFYVYDTMKIYWNFTGPSEEEAVKQECRLHNPKNALINMARQAGYSSKLFQSIVNGSRYSDDIFNDIVSIITKEAAICAILAKECDKFLHKESFNGPAQTMRNEQVQKNLKTIEEEIVAARQLLHGQFGNVVAAIIHEAVEYIDATGIGRREGVKHVHQVLSTKFTSRAWAVAIYKSIHHQEISDHIHESTLENWFHVDNGHHTVIAHYADKRSNCSFPGTNLSRMSLRQIIGDGETYNTFVKQAGDDLGSGILLLKKALKRLHVPEDNFISITSYDQSFSIAREYYYHFFEYVKDEEKKEVVKTVLIGWC